jgi:TonB-linked SusC/RagA family outer membrane protein
MRKSLTLLAVLVLSSVLVFAQTKVLTGRITDDKGQPVPFATIKVKSTKSGVSADGDGNFTIKAKTGDLLEISGTGVSAKEVSVGESLRLNITLERRNAAMTEVVVTALGQTQNKAKVGYSTQTFNSAVINRNSVVGALDGLQGKIAGADISSTGGPGASTKVVLRSYGNISNTGANNQPLYVIDGVPLSDGQFQHSSNGIDGSDYGNGMNNINPNDIESITVLKGTAASSLYGGLAKNGAIMITTKRGRAGKLRVEYSGGANWSFVGKLPDYQTEFGQGWGGDFVPGENGSWGPRLDGKMRKWGSIVDGVQQEKPFSAIKNPLKRFYTTGNEITNSVSLSGGNDITRFYLSYSNVSSDGIIPTKTDYLARNTFSLRTNSNFGNFTINSSMNYVDQRLNVPNTGQSNASGGGVFQSLLQIPVDIPINVFKDYNNKYYNVDNYFTPYADNPYFGLNENGNKQNLSRFFGNLDMSYKFTNYLSAQFRLGGDFTNTRTFEWKQPNAAAPGTWNATVDPTNTEQANKTPEVGSVFQGSDYLGVINGDFILKFNKDLSNDFNLDALAGANYYQSNQRTESGQVTNLIVPGFFNLTNTSAPVTYVDNLFNQKRIGGYGQVTLTYKQQLFLTGNVRNDWSSTLPKGKNSIFYPGANVSWLASQNFSGNNTVSYLKFRAAYGRTGSDPAPYLTYARLGSGTVLLYDGQLTFPFNDVGGFGLANTIYNNQLKPIFTDEFEVGTEARFLRDRIGLDLTLYDKKTKGQIFTLPTAPSTGYTAYVQNLGVVDNKGIEVSLNLKPVVTRDFTWNVVYIFAKDWNKVVSLTGTTPNPVLNTAYDAEMRAVIGKSVASIYAPVPQMTSDGKHIVVSASSGLPLVNTTPLDKYNLQNGYYGSGLYNYTMGLTNTFTYKEWSLNFNLDFRYGGVMYSNTADLSLFVGNSKATTYNDRKPFIIPNSVNRSGPASQPVYTPNSTYIGGNLGGWQADQYYSYWYTSTDKAQIYKYQIFDRSFLKLRDINLSYNLPARITSKIGMSSGSLGVYGRNFLLWTPRANIYVDPESTNYGNDLTGLLGEFGTAPLSKSYGFVLKLAF